MSTKLSNVDYNFNEIKASASAVVNALAVNGAEIEFSSHVSNAVSALTEVQANNLDALLPDVFDQASNAILQGKDGRKNREVVADLLALHSLKEFHLGSGNSKISELLGLRSMTSADLKSADEVALDMPQGEPVAPLAGSADPESELGKFQSEVSMKARETEYLMNSIGETQRAKDVHDVAQAVLDMPQPPGTTTAKDILVSHYRDINAVENTQDRELVINSFSYLDSAKQTVPSMRNDLARARRESQARAAAMNQDAITILPISAVTPEADGAHPTPVDEASAAVDASKPENDQAPAPESIEASSETSVENTPDPEASTEAATSSEPEKLHPGAEAAADAGDPDAPRERTEAELEAEQAKEMANSLDSGGNLAARFLAARDNEKVAAQQIAQNIERKNAEDAYNAALAQQAKEHVAQQSAMNAAKAPSGSSIAGAGGGGGGGGIPNPFAGMMDKIRNSSQQQNNFVGKNFVPPAQINSSAFNDPEKSPTNQFAKSQEKIDGNIEEIKNLGTKASGLTGKKRDEVVNQIIDKSIETRGLIKNLGEKSSASSKDKNSDFTMDSDEIAEISKKNGDALHEALEGSRKGLGEDPENDKKLKDEQNKIMEMIRKLIEAIKQLFGFGKEKTAAPSPK